MNIPTNRDRFKQWADRECVAWSADVQKKAYSAWQGTDADRAAFITELTAHQRG